MRRLTIIAAFICGFMASTTVHAQMNARYYVSLELGTHINPGVSFAGNSNDRSSICDEFINPLFASVPGCTDPARGSGSGWLVHFDRGVGTLASVHAGIRLSKSFRAELEYFVRSSHFNQTSLVASAVGVNLVKLNSELRVAEERLGDLGANNLFVNVYADWNRPDSRVTPFGGVGIGVGLTRIEWGSTWNRHPDPALIVTGSDQPNAEEIKANLAGTTSTAHSLLTDTVFGYQVIVGADYLLTEKVSFVFKARWVAYGEFQDTMVWDPLRSHDPNIRRDGSEPVHGIMTTSDLSVISLGAGIKYNF